MPINRKIVIVCLVFGTIVIGSLSRTVEGSRYHTEDENGKSPRHRHRHRHEGSSSSIAGSSRRNADFEAIGGRQPWPKEDEEYEDAFDVEEDDDEDEKDYEMERRTAYHDRSHQAGRNSQRNHHARFDSRFPTRHHQSPSHHSSSRSRSGNWEDPAERRRWRYEGSVRGHRSRSGRERTYHDDRRSVTSGYSPRHADYEEAEDDLEDEASKSERESSYERSPRRWRLDEETDDDRGAGKNSNTRRNSRRHRGRQETRRPWVASTSLQRNDEEEWSADWRRKIAAIHRKRPNSRPSVDESDTGLQGSGDEKKGTWVSVARKAKNNLIDRGHNSGPERRNDDSEDYDDDPVDEGESRKSDKRRDEEELEEDDLNEDEEDNVWKEAEEEPEDDEEDFFDRTNYYKTEDEPPYKTFDDIIKSLTSNDPTTVKPSVRRDYRNTEIEKYLKRDAYGNIYDSRNSAAKNAHETSSNWTSGARWRFHDSNKPEVASFSGVRDAKKILNAIGGDGNASKSRRDFEKKKIESKAVEDTVTRTKSLEQEYDEDYDNNEKDEDAAKVGYRATEMQADINNTDYPDEDNEAETEHETSAPVVTSTATTARTTTTTTTSKPVTTTATTPTEQEHKYPRSYDSASKFQSNGLIQKSGYTAHKWQSLSTRDGGKDSKVHSPHNNRNEKTAEIKEALQHAMKVSREGSCQWPRARVIPVRDVYPSPSTTYIPHCAILHRCSDDTGCCRSEALTCVPKISHRVELYFYSASVDGTSVVEKLSFYNHTECECKERTNYVTSDDKMVGTNEHRFTRHHPAPVPAPQNIRRPPSRKPCRCPSEFTPRITPEGECLCNCFENHQNCIRTKRGKGYFSLRDRLCIQNEECATPSCEFGEYMRRQGKCPRKKDKFDEIANHPANMNPHYRFRS